MAVADKVKGEVLDFAGFLARDNLLDVAVGMILGTAFGKLADSLVNDVVKPVLSTFLPHGYGSLAIELKDGVSLRLGEFLQRASNFVVQSLVLFLFLRHVARRDV
jgi:large conductance mechanosensitive channel